MTVFKRAAADLGEMQGAVNPPYECTNLDMTAETTRI